MKCKKCNSLGSIVLRHMDYYCSDCFINNTNHKFRACLGKNKVLAPNEKVLICLSGGEGSMVLLDLIYTGINKDQNKKLRIIPFFMHIVGLVPEPTKLLQDIKEQCIKYKFELHFIHISNYLSDKISLNNTEVFKSKQSDEFCKKLSVLSETCKNDLVLKIKRALYIKVAKALGCNTIFSAETSSTLASQLLSNLAIGRGSQVQNDIGFHDSRDKTVKILRPIKDISQDELTAYIKLKELIIPLSSNEVSQEKSLHSIINTFVVDLQQNFQATISTVCKTADKIGLQVENCDDKCCICENNLINTANDGQMSAFEATNISKLVSLEKPMHAETSDEVFNILDNKVATMLPHINKKLCYSCSRSYSEIENANFDIGSII